MISKRIAGRKDGRSSAGDSLRYGEGLKPDRETGEFLDKSHRTRLGNFGLVDDGVYAGRGIEEMSALLELAAFEMQFNCDLNNKIGADKKLAHLVVSYDQEMPSEAVLRDTEDSMLAALKLDKNHFATFLHNDNGYWHLHIFASRIEKEKPHRGNALWQDMTIRDKVCREVEIRHGLQRDNGLHTIDDAGQIIEVPRDERRKWREQQAKISDRARTTEIYSGEKSFQTWAKEIRIGDRLKHAKSWQDLHAAAAAYGCEVKPKGAGFVVCPAGEKGGIQLSKIGLKNLPAKFGAFQTAKPGHQVQAEATYKPEPTQANGMSHYGMWREAKKAFQPIRTGRLNEQREAHKSIRQDLRAAQKSELEKIRTETKGPARFSAVSLAKMQHAVELAALAEQFSQERLLLRRQLSEQGPGNTFRDYLVIEAGKGDNAALGLARKYGMDEATAVSRKREADQLQIVAAVAGHQYGPAPRMSFTHRIERSGTVVYNLGLGRMITDSATAKQVQLNDVAANSPEAIATALRFATSKFGNTLTLTGSPEFQRLAVETSVLNGLGIRFADPALEAYREKLAAEINRKLPTQPMEKQHASNHRSKHAQQIPPAHRRDRMHYLSDGNMVLDTERDVGALRKNVPDRLEQQQQRVDHGMQRTAGSAPGAGGRGTVRNNLPDVPIIHRHTTATARLDSHNSANVGFVRSSSGDGARTGEAGKRKRLSLERPQTSLQTLKGTIAMTKQHYVLRDGMEDEGGYSSEIGPNDFANPDSPRFAYNALADHAARLGRYEQPDSNKRLAWLEDSNGKIVAEATVSATTILDNGFQKAIEDEEQAILQEQAHEAAQDHLRAMVLSINPSAQFSIPDALDARQLHSGPVVAVFEDPAWFAQHIGRGVYVLHPISAPERYDNKSVIDVQYRGGKAVAIIADHEKGIGK